MKHKCWWIFKQDGDIVVTPAGVSLIFRTKADAKEYLKTVKVIGLKVSIEKVWLEWEWLPR